MIESKSRFIVILITRTRIASVFVVVLIEIRGVGAIVSFIFIRRFIIGLICIIGRRRGGRGRRRIGIIGSGRDGGRRIDWSFVFQRLVGSLYDGEDRA